MLQHVRLLYHTGIESKLFVLKKLETRNQIDSDLVNLGSEDIKEANILVATRASDVRNLYGKYNARGPILCHLCQGYEPVDLIARITEESVPEKYMRKKGLRGIVLYELEKIKFRRRIRRIEGVYALDTIKIAVSQHLKELIERKYCQKCYLVPNGIDGHIFHARRDSSACTSQGNVKIISVGSIDVAFKGITDTLEAIKILKHQLRTPVEFISVSPIPLTVRELESGIVDRYYVGLSEKQMADLYRGADIFVSSSLEGEGFGLPAIEAMSCGIPCVLTEISSYKNFDSVRNFAFFVPTHQPMRIAEAIKTISGDRLLRENVVKRGFEIA